MKFNLFKIKGGRLDEKPTVVDSKDMSKRIAFFISNGFADSITIELIDAEKFSAVDTFVNAIFSGGGLNGGELN